MASVAEYSAGFEDRAREVLVPAAGAVPALADRLAAAGLAAEDLGSVESLRRLPIMTKDDLLELQAKAPPFGGLLGPGAAIRRIFQSPGPLYEPEPDVPDPGRFGPALVAAGFSGADVVLNCFGYHLTPAGSMFEEAARSVGAVVVPAGVGNMELQARAARDLRVTAYIGTPSYLKALLEKTADLEGPPLRFERAVVGAEPLPPSLRSWLSERVPVVRQLYGTAETGLLGYECEELSGWHVPDDALVEVCALDDGRPVPEGTEGQVVVTVFSSDYLMVRMGTGDLSAFATGDCACGRPTPRLVGWLGRSGEAVKVRGMFLHPRQIAQVMSQLPTVAAYRFLIDRVEHKDALRCEVVPTDGAAGDLVAAVKDAIRSGLRFDVEVAVVDAVDPDSPAVTDLRTWD